MEPGAFRSGEPPKSAPAMRAAAVMSWPSAAQMAVVLIVTASGFFLLGRWSLGSSQPREESWADGGSALDLNRATKAELRLISGLGDALSQRIVEHRDRHGPFRSVDELRQVYGIGPKTLERIRPHVFVMPPEIPVSLDDADATPIETPRTSPPGKKAAELTQPIHVNQADQAELQKLPGIGPKLSQRILDERAKAPFKSIEELRRVPGIGLKTVEKLRPYVTVK